LAKAGGKILSHLTSHCCALDRDATTVETYKSRTKYLKGGKHKFGGAKYTKYKLITYIIAK